jgi:outer membrane protein TolC
MRITAMLTLRLFLSFALLVLCAPRIASAERPLTLQEAIALAVRGRAEITQAQIDRERAALNLLRARLERAHLTIQAGAQERIQDLNRQLTGAPVDNAILCLGSSSACDNEQHVYGGQADLTIPVWSGFTIEADIARARHLSNASQAQEHGVARGIALDVVHAYWAVRRAELLRDVEVEAVRRDEEIEQASQRRVIAGVAPQVDFNRAHVATLHERSQLALLEGQVAEARAQLAAVLQIEEAVRLTEDPEQHQPTLPPLVDSLAQADSARPELLNARAQVLAQVEAARSARGGYWPQLALFAHADAQNSNFFVQNLSQEGLFANFYAGIRVQWQIFDTLSTWATVRDAEYQKVRADADVIRLRFQVQADVRGAHARLARSLAQRSPTEQALVVARENLDILRRRYETGDSLFLEVLDGQVQLLRSESDRIDNAVNIAQSEAELQAAVGLLL